MNLNALTAISPVDGRYRNKVESLDLYFSEFALIKHRVEIEIEYFIHLAQIDLPGLGAISDDQVSSLRKIYQDFSEADAQEIKDTESITNHDVKAVEYFIKKKMEQFNMAEVSEFIHFGLTSQDINNTSVPLMVKRSMTEVYYPLLDTIIQEISVFAKTWSDIPMLAKTHGQPASPTLLGKEFMVFYERLTIQRALLESVPYSAKFGGATGNMNAHFVAYPDVDWVKFANNFVHEGLGLSRSQYTTQIEHYDNLAALCDGLKRINTILLDLCKDVWQYISMNYFTQKINKNEVGSSAMPHKVNPIDFENAEGNFGIANSGYEHLAAKLPISRLQRDLTDSTVLRYIGVPVGHTILAFHSLMKGLGKIQLNEPAITRDLEENWAVVAEAIQTVLRREKFPKPYEALKALTRTNEEMNKQTIHNFIDTLDVSDNIKAELKEITPFNYTGIPFLK